jgi:hypothetical protein
MKAVAHTHSMLRWWTSAGIGLADLAIKRPSRGVIWHYAIPLEALPLSWARAENLHKAEVYIRPARGYSWPLVLLDDVSPVFAARVARKYDALVVKTSKEGGCHLWLSCSLELDEEARKLAQRWLVIRTGADPGSSSGEHLGRLAGFKNWKRGGTWVNVMASSLRGQPWLPRAEDDGRLQSRAEQRPRPHRHTTDTSESGKEWGWVCSMLEAGDDPDIVYYRLVQRARPRRGHDAERYASRTINRAIGHVHAT